MEINLGKLPFDLDFHPSASIVATALISGELDLYHYVADSQPQRLFQISAHSESCRAVRFIASGRVVLTASRDCSIHATDVETGSAIAHMNDAHEDSINRLITLTETTIATGDDEGYIKVWDTRQHSCCNTFDAHEDYVSDMTYISGTRQILATSGDGSLSVCNLRKNKVQARSEFSEDELLSLVIMKNGKKVICGTQSGPLLLYSWGHFEDCSDRLLGHPMSVDALLKLDEDTLISGSEDGVIRLVGILPNRIIQPLAEHSEYPIESLAFSYDRKYLGSISHDQMLKLWDLEEFWKGHHGELSKVEVDSDDEDDDDDMDVDLKPSQPAKVKGPKGGNNRSSNNSTADFFADL